MFCSYFIEDDKRWDCLVVGTTLMCSKERPLLPFLKLKLSKSNIHQTYPTKPKNYTNA